MNFCPSVVAFISLAIRSIYLRSNSSPAFSSSQKIKFEMETLIFTIKKKRNKSVTSPRLTSCAVGSNYVCEGGLNFFIYLKKLMLPKRSDNFDKKEKKWMSTTPRIISFQIHFLFWNFRQTLNFNYHFHRLTVVPGFKPSNLGPWFDSSTFCSTSCGRLTLNLPVANSC